VVPKVEHDNVGKRGGEGGAVCLERASHAAAGAGVAALDVVASTVGCPRALYGGDAAGGGASHAPRVAIGNAVPSAALHRVEFSKACGPRIEKREDLCAKVGVFGERVRRVDEVTRHLDNLCDSVAGHGCSESGERGRRRMRSVGVTDGALAGTRGYLCGGRLELVCVPPLTTALALRPRAPRQRRSIETRL
jgi:hypothetical protein